MFLEQQDTLKKEFSNNFFPSTFKVFNINFTDIFNEKKIIDSKFWSINYLEDEVQNLFHSFDSDDFNNTDYLYDKRIYEITNNSDKKEKKLNSKRENSYNPRKQKIFRIKKIRNLLGRRKLNQPELYSCGANHTKFREDNIVRKIKIYFTNSTISYINKIYNEFLGIQTKKRLLGRVKPNFANAWTKKENQVYLSKKIKDVFSENLSTKCRRFPNNYNKKQIAKILKNNKAKEVINILNTSVQDIYEKYIDEHDVMPGFNLKYDLDKIEKRNGKIYATEYKRIAFNLIEILNKKGRKD
jgi:hypothetical protein